MIRPALRPDPASGTLLADTDAYLADFRRWMHDPGISWKLERGQHFAEPGKPIWDAFRAGQWQRSLDLIDADRDRVASLVDADRKAGVIRRRVRVVDSSMTAYVQWELHVLNMRAQCGENIRVVWDEDIAGMERGVGPLPELINAGSRVLYQVRYDAAGKLNGAVRHDSRLAVLRYGRAMAGLWRRGVDVRDLFGSRVAHLQPPVPGVRVPLARW